MKDKKTLRSLKGTPHLDSGTAWCHQQRQEAWRGGWCGQDRNWGWVSWNSFSCAEFKRKRDTQWEGPEMKNGGCEASSSLKGSGDRQKKAGV